MKSGLKAAAMTATGLVLLGLTCLVVESWRKTRRWQWIDELNGMAQVAGHVLYDSEVYGKSATNIYTKIPSSLIAEIESRFREYGRNVRLVTSDTFEFGSHVIVVRVEGCRVRDESIFTIVFTDIGPDRLEGTDDDLEAEQILAPSAERMERDRKEAEGGGAGPRLDQ